MILNFISSIEHLRTIDFYSKQILIKKIVAKILHLCEGIAHYIKEITRLSHIKVDYYIFTKEELFTMLINDEENLGKEAFRNYLLFYGVKLIIK
ncbi:MAG: hypothetical protein ABIG89_02705 [Candidatus Woesearchaeota archaeon]